MPAFGNRRNNSYGVTMTFRRKRTNDSKRGRKSRGLRRGIEAVETAITLPLMTLVMFSTIQITHRWHVEKLLKICSYEAIKAGAARDGDSQDAIRVFEEHSAALGINGAVLRINEERFDNARTGMYLNVRGTAPARFNRMPAPINLNFNDWMSGGFVYHRKEGL